MNSNLTKDEYSYLCLLLQAIDARKWDTLEIMLRSDPLKFAAVSEAISRSSNLNGMTVLHASIRFDPPPRLVGLILRLAPFSAGSVDCLNRTPLHIAAAVRANPQTISLLIHSCREACAIQDVDGKTPLHFACDINCELFEGEEGIVRDPPSMEIVKILVMAAPEVVPIEDRDDTSALEYAILSSADVTVVKLLMHLTQKQLSSESAPNQPASFLQVPVAVKETRCISPESPGCSDRTAFTV
ncbi:hypothetical protein ACHAWO_008596 [Cyclotella atomus]|uniref:Uncharacterized protein n=1 Tax=Cyclotella atomus TaxID=382360 RepID=A0ABD3PR37_9STRA